MIARRTVPLLTYHDDTTSPRRPLIVRRQLLIMLLILAAANLLVRGLGDRFWNGGMSLFWQEKCLTYQLPPDRIAFVAAPQGLALPPYLADFSNVTPNWNGTVGAAPYPIELAELQTQFAPHSNIDWQAVPAPVFLHGLRDSRGRTRIVTVNVLTNNPTGWWTLLANSREPLSATLKTSSTAMPVASSACWPMQVQPGASLVVFAGQADSKDSSAFTVRVQVNGQEQTVNGRLNDDGTVEFKSNTGLSPWSVDRAGPLLPLQPQQTVNPFQGKYDANDNVLLPVD